MKMQAYLGRYDAIRTLWRAVRLPSVAQRSPLANVYHCTTQRAASTWMVRLLRDPIVFKFSGLAPYGYVHYLDRLNLAYFENQATTADITHALYRGFDRPLPIPKGMLATRFYMGFKTFEAIPKREPYRAFFVMRDPRDLVTSWYFSIRYSHGLTPRIEEMRRRLGQEDKGAGLRFAIDHFIEKGHFHAMRSWAAGLAHTNPDLRIFRYEDLAADSQAFLTQLLGFMRISLPDEAFESLYLRHMFEALSGGRRSGDADIMSHYRSGTANDWRNHFTVAEESYFREQTGDLIDVLGYQW